MHTPLVNDKYKQIMLLLPWYLNQSLEHNELQRVECFLRRSFLGSGLKPSSEKHDSFNYSSKLSVWICGVAAFEQEFDSETWLSCAFSLLESHQRLIIRLTFYHGRSYQEIAKILNCSEDAVKMSMLQARKKIQAFVYNQEN